MTDDSLTRFYSDLRTWMDMNGIEDDDPFRLFLGRLEVLIDELEPRILPVYGDADVDTHSLDRDQVRKWLADETSMEPIFSALMAEQNWNDDDTVEVDAVPEPGPAEVPDPEIEEED